MGDRDDGAKKAVAAPEMENLDRAKQLPASMELRLQVRDPEVLRQLARFPEGEERDAYALTALRIGVLSMRMAGGQVDAAAIRESGKEVVFRVGELLTRRIAQVENELEHYFDPSRGQMQQRLKSLLSEDGELERLLRAHVGSDDSTIAKALARHLGEGSPVFKLLSPTESTGIRAQIEKVIEEALSQQRDQLLGQFSLDNKDSALARLRLELQEVLEKKSANDAAFHREVRETLAEYKIRKDEASKSTRHGLVFEDQLADLINAEANRLGDVFEATGATTGRIKGNKKGDGVVTLGPDSAAPGARVVWEAKQDQGYSLKRALDELSEARKNRDAGVGVFVFSAVVARADLETFARHGNDLVVVWDAEDEASDVRVRAAYSVARALLVGERREAGDDEAAIGDIDRAVRAVEEQIKHLDTLEGFGQDIIGKSEKIIDRVGKMKREIARQVRRLDEQLDRLKKV